MKPYRRVLSLLVLMEGVANLPKLHCQQVLLGISCVHMYVFSISYHQYLPYTYTLLISMWSRFFMGVAHIVAHGTLRSGKQICSFVVRGYSVNLSHAGTHNGKFHCDEVLACYMLRVLPEYSGAEIIRTRDPKVGHTLSHGCSAVCTSV